jgi:HD-GYP domain-containing protein (c-di-GMP phosphodiesterase class II)
MTSNRPYRKGIPPNEALKIFEKEKSNGQWDEKLVDSFIKLIKSETGL